jgi:aspartyl-tRNA(Asn)/glutamyl-tRNA(Gln) amidotransferase subunit C
MNEDVEKVLQHVRKIQELDLADVPPTISPSSQVNVFRDDVVEPSLPVEVALRGAPDLLGDRFRVPPMMNPEGDADE